MKNRRMEWITLYILLFRRVNLQYNIYACAFSVANIYPQIGEASQLYCHIKSHTRRLRTGVRVQLLNLEK